MDRLHEIRDELDCTLDLRNNAANDELFNKYDDRVTELRREEAALRREGPVHVSEAIDEYMVDLEARRLQRLRHEAVVELRAIFD